MPTDTAKNEKFAMRTEYIDACIRSRREHADLIKTFRVAAAELLVDAVREQGAARSRALATQAWEKASASVLLEDSGPRPPELPSTMTTEEAVDCIGRAKEIE